jgi:hypothetical protein
MQIENSWEALLPVLRKKYGNSFGFYNDLRSYGRRVKLYGIIDKREDVIAYIKSLNSEFDVNKYGCYYITIHFGLTTKPKTNLVIGDRVLIDKSSQYYRDEDYSNPKNVEGTIINIQTGDLGIRVKWDDGTTNSYNPTDLVKAKQPSYIPSTQIKQTVMSLSAVAITDLSQIKTICELIPSVKEQLKAAAPDLYAELYPNPTKVGDRYKAESGERYILAHEGNAVALVNLANGSITYPTVRVEDVNNITDDELVQITNGESMTLIKRS